MFARFIIKSLILQLVVSQGQLRDLKTVKGTKYKNNTVQNILVKKSSQENTLQNLINEKQTIKPTNIESTKRNEWEPAKSPHNSVQQNPLPNEPSHQKDPENVNTNIKIPQQPVTERDKVLQEPNTDEKMKPRNDAGNERLSNTSGLQIARLGNYMDGLEESRSINDVANLPKVETDSDDAESKVAGTKSEENESKEFEQPEDGNTSLDDVDAREESDQVSRPNWPMGVVPYYVNKTIFDDIAIARITQAMELIQSVSCIVFTEIKTNIESANGPWLHITNPDYERECVHITPGELNFRNEILLVMGFECMRPEQVLHTLLHGVGMKDEVTHPHRDHYVRVLWENIQPKYRPLYSVSHSNRQLSEYDPASIMHFHDRAFSANGAPTVAALIPGLRIAPSRTLSQLDVLKLKLAFSHACKARQVDGLFDKCKNAMPNKESDIDNNMSNDQDDDREKNEDESKESGDRNEISEESDEEQRSDSKKSSEDQDKSSDGERQESEDKSQIDTKNRNRFWRIGKRA